MQGLREILELASTRIAASTIPQSLWILQVGLGRSLYRRCRMTKLYTSASARMTNALCSMSGRTNNTTWVEVWVRSLISSSSLTSPVLSVRGSPTNTALRGAISRIGSSSISSNALGRDPRPEIQFYWAMCKELKQAPPSSRKETTNRLWVQKSWNLKKCSRTSRKKISSSWAQKGPTSGKVRTVRFNWLVTSRLKIL